MNLNLSGFCYSYQSSTQILIHISLSSRKKKRPSSLEKGINKEHRDIPNSSEITDKDSNFYKEKILKLMTAPQDFILENRVEIYEKDRRISYGTSGDGGNKLKVTMEFDTSSPGESL